MTTLFVAATGGHLDQLDHLARRLPGRRSPSHWVTFANEQSRSLLAGREVTFIPYVGVRDLRGVVRCLPETRRLLRRHGVTRAISTGSGIALGYLPYLAARGVECHYIESAARVSSPSVTGSILRRLPGVRTYTQYPHWTDAGWHHVGSVFDAYEPDPAPLRPHGRIHVVVTLGTAAEFPFRRLVDSLVPLLVPGGALERATGLPVRTLWQTGGTPMDDLPVEATPFLAADRLAAALRASDIIIAHAGAGSALGALEAGRRPLLAPRRPGREAGDDHQRELGRELERRGLAVASDADRIGLEDLLATMTGGVRPAAAPPPLALLP